MLNRINNPFKNRRILTALLLIVVLVIAVALPLGTYQPGFEGAKCNFHGVYVPDWDWDEGTNEYHRYQDAEDPIAWDTDKNWLGQTVKYEELYWAGYATPNDAGIGWYRDRTTVGGSGKRERPVMKIQVENNPQLKYITRQGDPDPLAWNIDDPLEGRIIEYWGLKGTKKTETEDAFIYEYEMTKEKFLITPAEFWLGFYLLPSKDDAGTGSGWREGEWQDLTAWFRLDFHVWDNAYFDDWLASPEAEEVFTTEYGGTVTSQQKLADPSSYRGGFPIAGWIQGWEKAGWTSAGGDEQSPIWWTVRGKETGEYTQEQLWDLKDILMSKCEFSPGMVGSFLSLYDKPDVQFNYVSPEYIGWGNTEALTNEVKAPDSRMKKVMYFPINVDNFGTYARDLGWWGLTGWKIYYPSAYFRIRMIYGVYGNFKYLWTEEVTKPFYNETTQEYEGGLDYPEEFERHGTTVIKTRGPLSPFAELGKGIGDWFTNPFNMLFFMFIMMIIVIVIATVLNPGMWASLALAYKSTRKERR